jgi:Ca2+-binding RTX toxin-like protein
LICAAAFLFVLAVAGPAFAARAEIVNGELRYEADPGELNNVTTHPGIYLGGGAIPIEEPPVYIEIADSGAAITAGFGCWQPKGAKSAHCEASAADSFSVALGDMADRFQFVTPLPPRVTSFVDGGAGDDELVGGPGVDNLFGRAGLDTLRGGPEDDNLQGDCSGCPAYTDILDGGPGQDWFDGGPGKDYADYSIRTADLTVSLDGTAADLNKPWRWDDGAGGEGDNVLSNVEAVWGGSGLDFLIGNPSPNALDGGGGSDRLDGGGGADELVGGDGVLDFARYNTRWADVKVTLDDVANDGQSGEGDQVHSDVEAVLGGHGNDTLVGNGLVTNFLYGGPGEADRVDGGEGPTRCSGGQPCVALAPRTDVLDGGPGTGDIADYANRDAALSLTLDGVDNDGAVGEQDMLSGIENFVGGSGDDYVSGNGASNRLTGGRGRDALYGWGGPDFIDSRDWWTDYIYCGDGPAADEAFDDDIDEAPAGDCETRALLSSEVHFPGR